MAELDHLILACPDLDEGIRHIENLTGARAVAGGPHPGMGSHNALLTFDTATYFEIIAIDPHQPDPLRPRPFGLDQATGPRLAGYAVHPLADETIDQVAALLRGAGIEPGPVRNMSRVKPGGEELHWRLTSTGEPSPPVATVPFIIDWGDTPSPATSLGSMGSLVSLRVEGADAVSAAAIKALGLDLEVAEPAPGEPRLVATVDSPNGRVEIS